MSQRVLCIDNGIAMKAMKGSKITDPVKVMAAWMDTLVGSSHDGKTIKSILHFQLDKRNGFAWDLIVLVDVE